MGLVLVGGMLVVLGPTAAGGATAPTAPTGASVAAAAGSGSAAARPRKPKRPAKPTTPPKRTRVLQLNLCLSGLAPCFRRTEYPAVVRETVALIRELRPDAVMVNEACTKDLERIARRTGLQLSYSTIIWDDKRPLACFDSERRPVARKRGHFGNAVLTRAAIEPGRDRAYAVQDTSSSDRRRINCARTARMVFCATHLAMRSTAVGEAANDAQCTELKRMMRRSARELFAVVAGDVNRRQTCEPTERWHVATDRRSRKRPGIQHVYADPGLGSRVRVRVVPMTYTDHDALLVTLRR